MTMTALLTNPVAWAVVAVVLLLIIILVVRARRRRSAALPYTRRASVLDAPRRALLSTLREAVGEQAVVLVRVPLRQVLAPRRHLGKRSHRKALARLAGHYFDFLLCSTDELRPLAAILVEDKRGKQQTESFEETAGAAAGLGVLRLDPEQRQSPEALYDTLRQWLEPRSTEGASDPLLDGRREPVLDLPRDSE